MSNVYYAQPTCLRIHGPLMDEIHDATIRTLINPFSWQWDLTLFSYAFSSTDVDLIQKIPLSTCLDCVSSATFVFSFFLFLFSFLLLRSAFHVRFCLSMDPVQCAWDPLPLWLAKFSLKCVCQWVLCTVHSPTVLWKCPSLSMGSTVLFTYLKIIFLQCFQLSIK